MAKHAVVRTDLVHGSDVRAELMSVKFVNSEGVAAEIENGNVVCVGGLMAGEREIFTATAPAADTAINKIALIASVEVMYDERKKNLDEFINEAGKACRAYRLHSGMIFSVTKEALDGAATPAVGDIVELKAGTKLNVKGATVSGDTTTPPAATSGSTVIGEIIEVQVTSRYTYYAIKVA